MNALQRLILEKKEEIENDSFLNSMDLSLNAAQIAGGSHYMSDIRLYMFVNQEIPCRIELTELNYSKSIRWFFEEYKHRIVKHYFNTEIEAGTKRAYFEGGVSKLEQYEFFTLVDNGSIIHFDNSSEAIIFLFSQSNSHFIEEVLSKSQRLRKRKQLHKPKILILIRSSTGIDTKKMDITKQKVSISENYNDDFLELHEIILKRLTRKNDKGIVLLHGKPGTGKTSYIRHLISSVKKDVIFLPPNMATSITNPDLISILLDNPNSVFVIEDAENIVIDREREGNSPVSALLNISDGLLSDCLNIQIICSFNTDLSKVDSALMRKGRLVAKYEFKELEIEKASNL